MKLALVFLVSAVAAASAADWAPSVPVDFAVLRATPARPLMDAAFTVSPQSVGAAAASVRLDPILDAIRRGRVEFKTGTTTVRVFGVKSRKKNWFVGFAADDGETVMINGHRMLHWAFIDRTAKFKIAGRAFSTWVEGKATDKIHSRLVVSPDDAPQTRWTWTIEQLSEDAYETGTPVTIGGRAMRLVYTRDFDEDSHGDFAGNASDLSITLLAKENGQIVGYHWFEREIPSDSVLVSTPKQAGADASTQGSFTVGLRMGPGRTLELYARPAASSR